jgi:hypothetical protein
MNNQVKPIVIVMQPRPQDREQNASCCSQFGDNLKVSSCFILSAYSNCIDGCDNSKSTYETRTKVADGFAKGGVRYEKGSGETMSMKECSQCLCLCGAIPLAVQFALLPFTFTGSAIYACWGKSC